MRGRLVTTTVVAVTLALAGASGWIPHTTPPAARALMNCDTGTAGTDAAEAQVLALANQERATAGLAPLLPSPGLSRAAAWKSEDRASSWGAGLSHTDSLGRNPSTRSSQCGYPGSVGENIAYGYPTPASVVEAWMASPGHRANILKASYTVAGVGYADGAWTMDFGAVNDTGTGTIATPTATSTMAQPTATRTVAQPTATKTAAPNPTPAPTVTPTPSPGPGGGPVLPYRRVLQELRRE